MRQIHQIWVDSCYFLKYVFKLTSSFEENFVIKTLMIIDELTKIETELYLKVCSLNGAIEEIHEQITKLGILNENKTIHQKYAELSSDNIDELKRGLFINWFAVSEPTFLIGIDELDENAQENIIKEINERIKNQTADFELNWMLNYYKNWNYSFAKFAKYEFFYAKIMSNEEIELPKIDKQKMANRGQMGIYCNSLN